MIEIKHKDTGEVLHTVDAETLARADLRDANLTSANLRGALLAGANLEHANLTDVDLFGANLTYTDLYETNLTDTNLEHAILGYTSIKYCLNLHLAKDLILVQHYAESYLDVATLRVCAPHLPDIFLQGVGYNLEEIENLKALYRTGIQFYSCFLSYARQNSDFADRLHADLLKNNVTCWQDKRDLRGGLEWEDQIGKAIKAHEKLVLVCSRQAIYRPNVVKEILQAIDTERETGERKLFPIRLDDHILGSSMLEEGNMKTASREWRENWVYYVQRYQIPDFSGWKDHDTYQEELTRLLRDLKNPKQRV